jgi:excinuclease ABC subunit C
MNRKDIYGHVPHACGVYLMRDAASEILYIGKAKDLAKRVAQYFNPARANLKTSVLVPLIRKIDYVPCDSEREALLLERSLVKEKKPFFNIALKDDKAYPYVKISLQEDFPRIFLARRKSSDGAAYFGPFPKVSPVRALLRFLWRRKYFRLRPCRWDFGFERPLPPAKINSCLYYHTGDCPAPCAGRISYEEYRREVENARLFFNGEYQKLQKSLIQEMKLASSKLDYERAARLRDSISALSQMGENVRLRALKSDDLSETIGSSRAVSALQQALSLKNPPFHIECFDVSHFQGHETVAAMVCFKGGVPYKAHYRRFRIQETAGIDDFKSMGEAVRRRYLRLKKEEQPYPDLILIDGGKGQLSAAAMALKEIGVSVPVISLAKRLEEVFILAQPQSIILERGSLARNLLENLRDEAHRFGIGYHRLLRDKKLLKQ